MSISSREYVRLNIGNLALAALLSLVPTAMTLGFLGIHGMILCNSSSELRETNVNKVKNKSCNDVNKNLLTLYFVWIWIFITIPTWRWFYIWHLQKKQHNK